MALQKFPLGRNAALYWNSNGVLITTDLATWLGDANTARDGNVRGLTLAVESNFADTSTRENLGTDGYVSQVPVSKNGQITFDGLMDETNALLTAMLAAWPADAQMAFAILNRDKDTATTGDIVRGWGGNCFVSWTQDQNSDDVQRGNWTLQHANFGEWYEITTP